MSSQPEHHKILASLIERAISSVPRLRSDAAPNVLRLFSEALESFEDPSSHLHLYLGDEERAKKREPRDPAHVHFYIGGRALPREKHVHFHLKMDRPEDQEHPHKHVHFHLTADEDPSTGPFATSSPPPRKLPTSPPPHRRQANGVPYPQEAWADYYCDNELPSLEAEGKVARHPPRPCSPPPSPPSLPPSPMSRRADSEVKTRRQSRRGHRREDRELKAEPGVPRDREHKHDVSRTQELELGCPRLLDDAPLYRHVRPPENESLNSPVLSRSILASASHAAFTNSPCIPRRSAIAGTKR